MSSKTKHFHSSTTDVQVVVEELYPLYTLRNYEPTEEDIEVILKRKILLAYPAAYEFSSLIKETFDKTTILYRLYAKVTVPIGRATRQTSGFNPVPKTRFESIINDMD